MSSPIDLAKSLLGTSPRDQEYLDFGDTSSWSVDERRDVIALLLAAAAGGDPRAPGALSILLAADEQEATLSQLLDVKDPDVRAAAGEVLVRLWRGELQASLYQDLLEGRAGDTTLLRIARLFLSAGDLPSVIQVVNDTRDERARTQSLRALWRHFGFDKLGQVWWRGLGLLRWKLDLPLPSFRLAAQQQFLDLIQKPASGQRSEDDATPMPPALQALVLDLVDSKGPVDAAAAAALPDELREAMLVNAATNALGRQSTRALQYALLLGGGAHRDLFEAAAASPDIAFAAAGKSALDQLSPN
jgi:hypothetical protein